MFTAKVKSAYPKLTASEKKVADYLILNCGELGEVSSHEIAELLGVGQSTVMRFSKKMGYSTYAELIADVRSSKPESNIEIGPTDTTTGIMRKLEAKYQGVIASVARNDNAAALESAADLLDRASSIVCYGYLNSHVFSDYLCDALIELGKNAVSCESVVQAKRRIGQLAPQSGTVVVVSKSGEKADSIDVASFASQAGVPVIAIADASENPLSKIAEIHLKVLEISDRSTPSVSMGTAAGVLMVEDALVTALFMRNRKQYQRSYGNSLIVAFSDRK